MSELKWKDSLDEVKDKFKQFYKADDAAVPQDEKSNESKSNPDTGTREK